MRSILESVLFVLPFNRTMGAQKEIEKIKKSMTLPSSGSIITLRTISNICLFFINGLVIKYRRGVGRQNRI